MNGPPVLRVCKSNIAAYEALRGSSDPFLADPRAAPAHPRSGRSAEPRSARHARCLATPPRAAGPRGGLRDGRAIGQGPTALSGGGAARAAQRVNMATMSWPARAHHAVVRVINAHARRNRPAG